MSLSHSVLNEISFLGHKGSKDGRELIFLFSPPLLPQFLHLQHISFTVVSTGHLLTEVTCTQHPFSVPVEIVSFPSEFIEDV